MARGETYQAAAAASTRTREYFSEDGGEDFSFPNSPKTGGTSSWLTTSRRFPSRNTTSY